MSMAGNACVGILLDECMSIYSMVVYEFVYIDNIDMTCVCLCVYSMRILRSRLVCIQCVFMNICE